jgi:hypothetical protein
MKKMAVRPRNEQPGPSSHSTPRWRKPDSNPWSHTWKQEDYFERRLEIDVFSKGIEGFEIRLPPAESLGANR